MIFLVFRDSSLGCVPSDRIRSISLPRCAVRARAGYAVD